MEFPQRDDPGILANKFGEFFYKKIELVKTEIGNISVDPLHFYLPQVKLENFSSISEDEIREIISAHHLTLLADWIPFLRGLLSSAAMN